MGTHLGQPEVERWPATKLTLNFEEAPLLDADGELHAIASKELRIRVDPGAIRAGIADVGGRT
jgi:diacylglycerol kinase family enzyme